MTNERTPAGWRIEDWLREAGHPFSRTKLYTEIKAGKLKVSQAGRRTMILTSPAQYYAQQPQTVRNFARRSAAA
jgi:hypothetical protein